jgi:hypothetical protein
MSTDPVLIYSGQYTEAIFLKTLLEGSGIPASLADLSDRLPRWQVYVAQGDIEEALPIVDDFKEHGKKTQSF